MRFRTTHKAIFKSHRNQKTLIKFKFLYILYCNSRNSAVFCVFSVLHSVSDRHSFSLLFMSIHPKFEIVLQNQQRLQNIPPLCIARTGSRNNNNHHLPGKNHSCVSGFVYRVFVYPVVEMHTKRNTLSLYLWTRI